MTGKPEVIESSVGLVPTNAHLFTRIASTPQCRLFVEVDRMSVGTLLYMKCARIERFQCIGVSF